MLVLFLMVKCHVPKGPSEIGIWTGNLGVRWLVLNAYVVRCCGSWHRKKVEELFRDYDDNKLGEAHSWRMHNVTYRYIQGCVFVEVR